MMQIQIHFKFKYDYFNMKHVIVVPISGLALEKTLHIISRSESDSHLRFINWVEGPCIRCLTEVPKYANFSKSSVPIQQIYCANADTVPVVAGTGPVLARF